MLCQYADAKFFLTETNFFFKMALMRKMIFKAAVSLLITAIFAVIFAAPVR